MNKVKKIGIIICDRYSSCAGGKCLQALRDRKGAFSRYKNEDVELVGYTTCGSCPGGNVEYAPEEMKKNGADVIHLATGLLVGYPPCPRIDYFKKYIESRFGIEVVMGTHPVPQKYLDTHQKLKTWKSDKWQERLSLVMGDKETRVEYN